VAVELCVEGQPGVISGGVAGTAYRIVQEALTNVLKHAGGAPSRVTLRWSDSALELEIVDAGPPQDDARRDASAGSTGRSCSSPATGTTRAPTPAGSGAGRCSEPGGARST
jgi:signal transduction histidine kinase